MLTAVLCGLKRPFEVGNAHQLLQSAYLHIHPLHFLHPAADALDSAFGLSADVYTWSNCCMSKTLLLASPLPPLLCFAFLSLFKQLCKKAANVLLDPSATPLVKLPLILPLHCILHRPFAFATCFACSSSGTAAWRNFSSNPYVVCTPLLIQSSQKTGLLRRKAKVTLSHSCKQIHTEIWWSFQKCQEVNSNQLYLCRHVKNHHIVSVCVLEKKGREEEKPLQRTKTNPFILKSHREISRKPPQPANPSNLAVLTQSCQRDNL